MSGMSMKQRMAGVMLAGFLGLAVASPAVVAADNPRWEYKVSYLQLPVSKKGAAYLEKWFNEMAGKGWEVQGDQRSGLQLMVIFKRKK